MNLSAPSSEIVRMHGLYEIYLFSHKGFDRFGQHDDPVFFPFAVEYGYAVRLEVDVLDPQAKAFHEPQPAAVEQLYHGLMHPRDRADHLHGFFMAQNDGYTGLLLCTDSIEALHEVDLQHVAVEKQNGVECLILRR